MNRKVALVTGGNTGIGLSIVRQLCQQFDGDVILTARNVGRGEAATALLASEGLKPVFHHLDVTSQDSIEKCRDFLQNTDGGLDVLVNNAGVLQDPELDMAAESERVIATNFHALNNTCRAFFPLLKDGARVVHLGSRSAYLMIIQGSEELCKKIVSETITREELEDYMDQFVRAMKEGVSAEKGWYDNPYSVSKLGVQMLTRIQQKELDSSRPLSNILVNCCSPGYVSTNMTKRFKHGGKPAEEGAKTPVYLAMLSPDRSTPRGGFLADLTTVLPFTADKETARLIMEENVRTNPGMPLPSSIIAGK